MMKTKMIHKEKRTIVAVALFVTSLVLAIFVPRCEALPGGAPVCTADESAPSATSLHRSGTFTEGTLEDGRVRISIGGVPAEVGVPIEVETGRPYEVIIRTGGDDIFRGVMTRLAGGDAGVDTTTIFSLQNAEDNLQISEPCLGLNASMVVVTVLTFLERFAHLSHIITLLALSFSFLFISGRRHHPYQS